MSTRAFFSILLAIGIGFAALVFWPDSSDQLGESRASTASSASSDSPRTPAYWSNDAPLLDWADEYPRIQEAGPVTSSRQGVRHLTSRVFATSDPPNQVFDTYAMMLRANNLTERRRGVQEYGSRGSGVLFASNADESRTLRVKVMLEDRLTRVEAEFTEDRPVPGYPDQFQWESVGTASYSGQETFYDPSSITERELGYRTVWVRGGSSSHDQAGWAPALYVCDCKRGKYAQIDPRKKNLTPRDFPPELSGGEGLERVFRKVCG